MTFGEYIAGQPVGRMKQMERVLGVGYSTLHKLKRGHTINTYDVAKRISDATDGAVSVAELCEAPKRKKKPVKKRAYIRR